MSNLKLVHRTALDPELWNNSIKQYSLHYPYANAWYLDALTNRNWYGLIGGNYDLVMPIPYNRKIFGFKQVYQPFLTQSLDAIGDLSRVNNKEIAELLQKQFVRVRFNTKSVELSSTVAKPRVNQEIRLDQSLDKIRSTYSKSTKQHVRKAMQSTEVAYDTDYKAFMEFYVQAEFPTQKPILKIWKRFERLLEVALANEALDIISLYIQGEKVGSAVIMVMPNRVINLIGASSQTGRTNKSNYVKIDSLLEKYAESKNVFDFFGSNLPGVHQFNASFGAYTVSYHEMVIK